MWGRITIDRTRRIMLESGRDPLACGFRWVQAAEPRLYVLFGFIERYFHGFLMRQAYPLIVTGQRRQADRLRSIEGQIPSGPVSDFLSGLGLDRVPMPDELFSAERVFAF